MWIDGKPVVVESPVTAKSRRIRHGADPEDRKTEGLLLPMTVRDNLSFAALDRLTRRGVIDRKAERAASDAIVRLLHPHGRLRCAAGALSGGKQKVVIAKWLMRSRGSSC